MQQVLAVIAAMLVGGALGSSSGALLGVVLGVLALWAGSRFQQFAQRLDSLERRLAERDLELARLRAREAPVEPPATTVPRSVPPVEVREPVREPVRAPERAPTEAAGQAALSSPAPAAAEAAVPKWAQSPPSAPEFPLPGWFRDWLAGGNTLVRVGVIVLFFGVAFLLRYVAERTELPIEFRLAGIALGAVAMLVLGWRLRRRRPGYALAIQGGAIGILYLTVFAALRLYALLPPAAAFALLVLITVFATALAVLQDSLAFALLSAAGAFLAPVLASSGQGDHVTLFGYYLVLTAGLVAVAWFKAWRPLMLLGFLATFVVATAWGVLRYRAELFATTEPFVVLFFLAYLAIAVLFALRQPPDLKGYVDGTLVFGPPVAAFALQSALLHDERFKLAFSALAIGGLYIGLAAVLWRRHRETLRLLVESFLALGIAFLTLAVPLAIDGHWTAATWALEGAALLWVGCRQDRRLPRAAGVLLQWAAGLLFWRGLDVPAAALPLLNSGWLGGVMVALAAAVSAVLLQRSQAMLREYERSIAGVMFVWSLGWWLFSGGVELDRLIPDGVLPAALIVFLAVTAWLSSELQRRVAMPLAQWPAWLLAPVLTWLAVWIVERYDHPAANGGWWAWPVAMTLLYVLLRRHADAAPDATPDAAAPDVGDLLLPLSAALHTASAWLLLGLVTTEFAWQVERVVAGGADWAAIAHVLPAWAALWLLPTAMTRLAWPVARHAVTYATLVAGGLALFLVFWLLAAQLRAGGNAAPLPYVPLLNPLDLMSGLVVAVLLRHWRVLRASAPAVVAPWNERAVFGTLAALGFVWLNGALLRAVHHWGGVPYELAALLGSTLTQVALSIFWTVLALGAMLLATRRAYRIGWLVGAALLAIVVVKLFLVDLSRVGSIERIVSFVVVGVLILVVGYFSPLPPADADDPRENRGGPEPTA